MECKENNQVKVSGTVLRAPSYSHTVYAERFYVFTMLISRLSETDDEVNILVSERLLDTGPAVEEGQNLTVSGQFRSYNNYTGEGNRLVLTVFAKTLAGAEASDLAQPNYIYLDGYICKPPVYRTTPFGREITDILVAVNRAYNKSDYIPAIAWGRNARYCKELPVGTRIRIEGRIQSRAYIKRIDEETSVTKIAYEVSVGKLEVVEEESQKGELD